MYYGSLNKFICLELLNISQSVYVFPSVGISAYLSLSQSVYLSVCMYSNDKQYN